MEATKALSARPELALAYEAFRTAVWQTPGLTLRERGLIHLLVADRVRSTYCTLMYASALERDLGGPEGIRAFLRDHHHHARLSGRDKAILDYALAAAVGHPRREHIMHLRNAGLDDAAILDVAVTAAQRLLGSRLYEALGVEADPFFLEQTDLMEVVASGDAAAEG
jgi:uncharacterized peroxidase-related enzyme